MDKGLEIPESFILDRHDIFEPVDRYIESGGAPLVLTGEPGCGKTTFLKNWTDENSTIDSPHPVLYANAGSRHKSLGQIYRDLKIHFDIPLPIPSNLGKLDSEFARWLYIAGQNSQFTIIIDNLEIIAPDNLSWLPPKVPDNVRLIVAANPGDSLNILKSRDWQEIEIPPLSIDERAEFILAITAQSQTEIDPDLIDKIKLHDRSANPLYLKVLLESILNFPDWAAVIDHYLQCDSVPSLAGKFLTSLSDSYRSTDENLIRDLFTLIAVSENGLTVSTLTDILGITPGILNDISVSPLLSMSRDNLGNLRLAHDEIAVAITYLWLSSEHLATAAHLKLADHFDSLEKSPGNIFAMIHHLTGACEWNRLRDLLADLPNFETAWKSEGLSLHAAWSKIKLSSDLSPARVHQSVINNPSEVAADITLENLAEFLLDESHASEAVKLLEFASDRYRRSGFHSDLVRTLIIHAGILKKRFEHDNAFILYREAESLCRENEYTIELETVLHGLSSTLHKLGENSDALTLIKEREKILLTEKNQYDLAGCYSDMAAVYTSAGKHDLALEYYAKQEAINREIGDPDGLVRCLNNRGALLMKLGRLDDALDIFTEQEELCRNIGYRTSLQVTLGNIGWIRRKHGAYVDALKLFKEQERICREIDNPKYLQSALKSQAMVLRATGDWEKALKLLQEQEKILRGLGDRVNLRRWLSVQAQILREHGRLRGALRILLECQDIAREMRDVRGLQITLADIAGIYMRLDESDAALSILRDEEKLCVRLDDLDALQNCLGMQAVIHHEKFDFDESLKLHAREEDVCRKSGNLSSLQRSLGNQALVLREQGKLRSALKKHQEEERINRSLDNTKALQRTLGNMASVLIDLSRFDEALKKVEEQEEICGRLKMWDNLSIATGKRAWAWSKMGRITEAKELIEDLYQHALDNRMHNVVSWMKPVYMMIKNMANL